ncbi:MAG: carboxypeptidase regulatory-like domain protein [Rhizobium sp.]|nr:carboxypeptidase regulatory-like domain protein [Rhizobium sp.]
MFAIRTLALAAAMFSACAASALAGSVSGQVTDRNGAPLADVHVEVVYQTYTADQLNNSGESIKSEAVTDADGRYMISTDGMPPGEYSANAYQLVTNAGQQVNIDLTADDTATFAGNADTVRNFTAGVVESSGDQPYGNAGIFVVSNAIMDYTDLSGAKVTLVNTETGETFVKTVRSSGEGLVVTGIPFATYRASISLNGQPMRIALRGPGQSDAFSSEIVHDFSMGYLKNQIQVQVKP